LAKSASDEFVSSSFRDAPLGASPESIRTIVVMDSARATLSRPGMTEPTASRERSDCPDGQISHLAVQPLLQKYFA
jgi:hypothetical protein